MEPNYENFKDTDVLYLYKDDRLFIKDYFDAEQALKEIDFEKIEYIGKEIGLRQNLFGGWYETATLYLTTQGEYAEEYRCRNDHDLSEIYNYLVKYYLPS